ncbi:MAG: type I 3-dehydroquinate dehydratase [Negativicutes bacterium]|nr:type I 3-dehydroquinate dehydratase [Negativicutes bacterium]
MKPKLIGDGTQPLICTPLVGKTREAIFAELAAVLEKQPDVIEWRADFFDNIASPDAVIALANEIKEKAGGIALIFTIRSVREGGQPVALSDREAIELNAAICEYTNIDYVDCELSNKPEDIAYLRAVALKSKTKIIASYHNFGCTPQREELAAKFDEADRYGLDVAKVAVMPEKLEDVLTLLAATLEAKQRLNIPLISMSMGGYGAITRMMGGVFGSSLTFAVGQSASAPGQVPIDDLRTVLDIVEKSLAKTC